MAYEENDNRYNRLQELSGSDYEIVDGEPDITGWDVKTADGKKVGDVDDLLFDPETGSVRYIIVDLDDNELDLDDDKKVLVPIGIAELYDEDTNNDYDTDDDDADDDDDTDSDEDDDTYNVYDDDEVVLLPNVTAAQLSALPAYERDNLTPETESTIRNIFEGAGAAGLAGASTYHPNEFYNHEHFNENKFYTRNRDNNPDKLPVIREDLEVGKTEVQTGGTRIRSRIVEQPVEENLNLREEHVTVERTPVDRPLTTTDSDAFKEEEFELTEHKEVPVVNKEARVVEEVSLNKEVEEREETIKDTLRNTEVDTERIDPDKRRDQF